MEATKIFNHARVLQTNKKGWETLVEIISKQKKERDRKSDRLDIKSKVILKSLLWEKKDRKIETE